jgi:hypothetical protein
MGFFIAHRVVGDDERDPPLDRLDALLDEVDEDPPTSNTPASLSSTIPVGPSASTRAG